MTEKPTVVVPLVGPVLAPGVPSETRAELVPVTVPVLPASAALRPRLPGVPGDLLFGIVPAAGACIGLCIRSGSPWLIGLMAAALAAGVAGKAVANRFGLRLPRRAPAWSRGLVHIVCTGCGADLDYAQPEFARPHPAPLCVLCRALVARGELKRSAVVIPTEGGTR